MIAFSNNGLRIKTRWVLRAGWLHCNIMPTEWKSWFSEVGHQHCTQWHNWTQWDISMSGLNNGTFPSPFFFICFSSWFDLIICEQDFVEESHSRAWAPRQLKLMSCIHSLFLCLWLAGVFIKSSLTCVIFLMVKVGNVGGREFSESLAPDVQKLLVSVWRHNCCGFHLWLSPWLLSVCLRLISYQKVDFRSFEQEEIDCSLNGSWQHASFLGQFSWSPGWSDGL